MTFPRVPVRRLGDVHLGKMIQPTQKGVNEVEAQYLRAAHVQPNGRIVEVAEKKMWFSPDELAAHDLRRGDVVVVEGGAGFGRSAVVSDDRAGWGFQNSIVRIRPREKVAHGWFIDYALQAAQAAGEIDVACFTATIPHFTADKVAAFALPAPSAPEQRAIADFLDRETARIDTLIEEQQRLIDLLRERRQAAITRSTASPDGRRVPLVRCMTEQVDYRGATPAKTDSGIQLVTARNVKSGWIDYETSKEFINPDDYAQVMRRGYPRVDDLLFTMEAPLGNAALVDRVDIALAQRVIKWTINRDRAVPKYLLYAILGNDFQFQLRSQATGSTALGIKASKLPALHVSVPSLDEQRRIVAYLDEQMSKIDTLIAETERFIALARERRAALITAAVTGQFDVG